MSWVTRVVCGLSISLAVATVLVWSVINSTVNNSGSRQVLLFAGDSLTEKGTDPIAQGWVTLLQSRYTRSADVIARGLSGYNSKWLLKDVVPFIEQEIRAKEFATPSLIAIWLGANDAALWNGSNSETHVPIKQYKENLVKIASGLWITAPTAKLLLITPPHVDDATRLEFAVDQNDTKRGLLDRTNAMSKEYARACVEAAGVLGVPVLDLNLYFNAMPESERNALLLDGFHFNVSGNQLVYEQLQSKIATELPSLNDALENWQFPPANKWVGEDPWTAGSKSDDGR